MRGDVSGREGEGLCEGNGDGGHETGVRSPANKSHREIWKEKKKPPKKDK